MKGSVRFIFITIIVVFFIFFWYPSEKEIPLPFKCSNYSQYHLNDSDGNEFILSVGQDLRIQNMNSGYLMFSGQVKNSKGKWTMQRGIIFSQGTKMDNNTFKFHIKRVSVSPEDKVPEEYFATLLREFSIDGIRMQFEVINIGEKAYIIGSPFSFLFSCVRY